MSTILRTPLKLLDYIPYKTHIYALACFYIGSRKYYEVYQVIKTYFAQCKDRELFYKRHSCAVFYRSEVGLLGWPPHTSVVKASGVNFFENLYEPILYFIKTAQKSIDAAVMLISVKGVFEELIKAAQRGVKVRIIMNFDSAPSREQIRLLTNNGIQCRFYLGIHKHMESIMHHKFMVKDFDEDNGFLCTGSLNISVSSVTTNYEQLVFTMQRGLVEQFHDKFLQYWNYIDKVNNSTLVNRVTLEQAGLPIK